MRAGLNRKDSQSARRADRSCQRQARLHTVGFIGRGPKARRPAYVHIWPKASLRALYPSQGGWAPRVRIDGLVPYSSFRTNWSCIKYRRKKLQDNFFCKHKCNKTKVISADLLEFDFDLDLNLYDILDFVTFQFR